MIRSDSHLELINSTIRKIDGVFIDVSSAKDYAVETYTPTTALKNFTIDRVGENKFFGYGISQKLTLNLVDKDRVIEIGVNDEITPYFYNRIDYIYPYPVFYVTEVVRNENTNELTITAYDLLYKANENTVSQLVYDVITIQNIAYHCAQLLGLVLEFDDSAAEAFDIAYTSDGQINFDGTETIRETLNYIAEATQTIYYICEDKLRFKRLDKDGEAVAEIGKDKYFKLDSKTDKKLTAVCHATELGDNVLAESGEEGETQYIRNNPLWDLRADVATLVDNALAAVNGLTINQFNLEWRGNYLIELCDKIKIITKDNAAVYSYLLNDTVTYDGSFKQVSSWSYTDATQSAANPSSLGEIIRQTYAKVDKANRQIDLVVSEANANKEQVTALQLNTDSIAASVASMEKSNEEAINGINEELTNISNKVEASMTSEAIKLEIQKEIANGTTRVETTTGFTFDEEGITVSKSGSNISTLITEDGMQVKKNNTAVLVADNEGVTAVDLHATTYLVIGKNSRFEDYGKRTACFWIGG